MEQLGELLPQLNELDFDLEDAQGASYEALQEKADDLMAEALIAINDWVYARAREECDIIEGIFAAHGIESIVDFDEETGDLTILIDFDHIGYNEED